MVPEVSEDLAQKEETLGFGNKFVLHYSIHYGSKVCLSYYYIGFSFFVPQKKKKAFLL